MNAQIFLQPKFNICNNNNNKNFSHSIRAFERFSASVSRNGLHTLNFDKRGIGKLISSARTMACVYIISFILTQKHWVACTQHIKKNTHLNHECWLALKLCLLFHNIVNNISRNNNNNKRQHHYYQHHHHHNDDVQKHIPRIQVFTIIMFWESVFLPPPNGIFFAFVHMQKYVSHGRHGV